MIRLKDIRKTRGDLPVLDGIGLDIREKEITALIGPSGCGKTTLLHILSGLDQDFEGTIEEMPQDLSFCFQEERLLPWKTARENIEFVQPDPKLLSKSNDHILEVMELSSFSRYPVKKLSGGMRQRVAIARALAYPSGTVLMDEPFKSLDSVLKQNIFQDLITLLEDTPRTVILVTHDLSEAFLLADRIAVLSERPARVMKVIEVPFPRRERNLEQKEFSEIKKEILSWW